MNHFTATDIRHQMANCLYQAEVAKTQDEARAIMRDWQVLNELYNTATANRPEFS